MSCPRHGDTPPYRSYAVLIAEGLALMSTAVYSTQVGKAMSLVDYGLLGVATHKLARLIATDRVTSVLRAPLTEQHDEGGHIDEHPSGVGMQRALGELVTCPYCLSPWVASSLMALYARHPDWIRPALGLMSSVAVSDLLNHVTSRLSR